MVLDRGSLSHSYFLVTHKETEAGTGKGLQQTCFTAGTRWGQDMILVWPGTGHTPLAQLQFVQRKELGTRLWGPELETRAVEWRHGLPLPTRRL